MARKGNKKKEKKKKTKVLLFPINHERHVSHVLAVVRDSYWLSAGLGSLVRLRHSESPGSRKGRSLLMKNRFYSIKKMELQSVSSGLLCGSEAV